MSIYLCIWAYPQLPEAVLRSRAAGVIAVARWVQELGQIYY